MGEINFFTESLEFSLNNQGNIQSWIIQTIESKSLSLDTLNVIFCDDNYLLGINQQYLQHDTLTDIITFDNSEEENTIEGDIFISIERVRDNAQNLQITFEQELHRVIIHGVLHLLGYGDKTPEEKQEMRKLWKIFIWEKNLD